MTSTPMLTTTDNPYDPFEDFTQWFLFDAVEMRYNTCGRLARIARTSKQLSDEENNMEIERAINSIIKHDPLNIYRKVWPKDDQRRTA